MLTGCHAKRTAVWIFIAVTASIGFWLALPQSIRNQIQPTAYANSYYFVNTLDDHDDGVCDAADCTLREAILAVNGRAFPNTRPRQIIFSIPGSGVRTINVKSPLPQIIADETEIGGLTENGMPVLEINGANAGPNANGLSVGLGPEGPVTVGIGGFIINRFSGYGINVDSPGVRIVLCFIGTNATGTASAPNGAGGIRIHGEGGEVHSNVISGNSGDGIDLFFGNPLIQGNLIGTNAAGTAEIPNTGNGIKIENNGRNATIGGSASGNGNVISGNTQAGIQILGSSGPFVIQNNLIGTNSSGTGAISNGVGIDIERFADHNQIIGNVISGNRTNGIEVNANDNTFRGNLIGTNVNGTSALGNGNGVQVQSGAQNNTIGGTATAAGNVISGNNGSGIAVTGGSGTSILGNFIGLNAGGNYGISNGSAGVEIRGGAAVVGGVLPGSRNVISGNNSGIVFAEGLRPAQAIELRIGVLVEGGTGSQVVGNFIGTDVSGAGIIPNDYGVVIDGAANSLIGGTTPAAGNIIKGSVFDGVAIEGIQATKNIVQSNLIASNGFSGVAVGGGASNNQIGGTELRAGNTINGNGSGGFFGSNGGGVRIDGGTGNAVLGNSIFSNSLLGIDLGLFGVTPNDNCESAVGPNVNPQNFPVITSASADSTTTTIRGTLNSSPNTQFRIEFFANSACDSSGNGQGQTFLGFVNTTTDAACNANFMFSVPNASVAGPIITATATDSNNNTSEFSACATLAGLFPTIQFSAATYTVGEGDKHVEVTITRSSDSSAPASVSFTTADLAGTQSCNALNGVASSRCDYETRIATVKFAPGETSKTISISIVDDSYLEGPETFSVGLSNGVGAFLVPPSTAIVTIADNDLANGPNPIDTAGFFVRQQYLDFLSREPDQSGLDFWTNQITSCGADQACTQQQRMNVSAAFILSIEFQRSGFLVERIYKAAFHDASGVSTFGDPHELAVPFVRLNDFLSDTQQIGEGVVVGQSGWETVLENNTRAFLLDFVQRPLFLTKYPAPFTPAFFVDQLFQNTGVTPSTADRNAAIAEFGSARDISDPLARSRALRDVAENAILKQQEFNRAFVLSEYVGYLRRNPNDFPDSDYNGPNYTGYDFWLTKLNQFNGDFARAEMVNAFISSAEYRQRFGP